MAALATSVQRRDETLRSLFSARGAPWREGLPCAARPGLASPALRKARSEEPDQVLMNFLPRAAGASYTPAGGADSRRLRTPSAWQAAL